MIDSKNLTAKSLAEMLNNGEYLQEISDELAEAAAEAGLVVVYGGSDDLVYFAGAISEEYPTHDTKEILIHDGKIFPDQNESGGCYDNCSYFSDAQAEAQAEGRKIETLWGKDGYSWTYKTDIPHETFDIFETYTSDREKYCRGIVFEMKHVQKQACEHSEKVPFKDIEWCPECGAIRSKTEPNQKWLPIRANRERVKIEPTGGTAHDE